MPGFDPTGSTPVGSLGGGTPVVAGDMRVSEQAAYVAIQSQGELVTEQAAYVVLQSEHMFVTEQAIYVVLIPRPPGGRRGQPLPVGGI